MNQLDQLPEDVLKEHLELAERLKDIQEIETAQKNNKALADQFQEL